MSRPQAKRVRVDPSNPVAAAVCDRCSKWRNRTDLVYQMQWAGQRLYSTGALVCVDTCYDKPTEQLRTYIMPPDPPPVLNARVPNFNYEESGPVQSTLTADVAQFAINLPVISVSGFVIGNKVWIQLNNGSFAEEQITGIDVSNNILSIQSPLPFSAPYTGVVSVANS